MELDPPVLSTVYSFSAADFADSSDPDNRRLFCLSLFQINFSDVPPPYPKKIKLNLDNLLFDLYFIIPILIARLQFPEMRKEMQDDLQSTWSCLFVASRLFEKCEKSYLSMKLMLKTSTLSGDTWCW